LTEQVIDRKATRALCVRQLGALKKGKQD